MGYLRERDGCRVAYQGIIAGLDDLGGDLLDAARGGGRFRRARRWRPEVGAAAG